MTAEVMTLSSGDTIFRHGEAATHFYVTIKGLVKLFRITPSGDEAVIHVFEDGDCFAEAAAFLNARYPVTAMAVNDSRIVAIPVGQVMQAIRDNPELAFRMIASMSQHLHRLVQDIVELKAQTGTERLAAFLASLCAPDATESTLILPYEKSLIAGRIGLTPETLSRALARLKPEGVEVNQSRVTVRDVARLRTIALGAG